MMAETVQIDLDHVGRVVEDENLEIGGRTRDGADALFDEETRSCPGVGPLSLGNDPIVGLPSLSQLADGLDICAPRLPEEDESCAIVRLQHPGSR